MFSLILIPPTQLARKIGPLTAFRWRADSGPRLDAGGVNRSLGKSAASGLPLNESDKVCLFVDVCIIMHL